MEHLEYSNDGRLSANREQSGSYPHHHSNRDANNQLNNSGALKEEEVPLLSSGKENRTSYWSDYGTLSNEVLL